jgi:hypothetical protein
MKFKVGDYVRMKSDPSNLFQGYITEYRKTIDPITFQCVSCPLVDTKYGIEMLIDECQLERRIEIKNGNT